MTNRSSFAALLSAACALSFAVPSHAETETYIIGGDARDDTNHVMPWAIQKATDLHAKAFIFLGDMELTPVLDAHFRGEIKKLGPIPFYPIIGNHEVLAFGAFRDRTAHHEHEFREDFLGKPTTPVNTSFKDKIVYSVLLPGGLHLIALDNVSLHHGGFGTEQLTWLKADLEKACTAPAVKHIIVGMHKALAKNGKTTHAMDEDGPAAIADSDKALELLESCAKVKVIFASHEHLFTKLELGKKRKIESYITGGLGAPLTNKLGKENAVHHALKVDVTDDKVAVSLLKK
jgi:hypothetical protein